MFDAAGLLGLYAETPLHPGCGSERGVVDLPIQREAHTNLPFLPGSSLKGVLRSVAEARIQLPGSAIMDTDVTDLFGPKVGSGNDHGGALSVVDARLLLFPVRSVAGMFTWVTSPVVLGRLGRDAALCGLAPPEIPEVGDGQAVVGTSSALTEDTLVFEDEDYDLVGKHSLSEFEVLVGLLMPRGPGYASLRDRIASRVAVLSDGDFARLTEKGTAKTTRIRLNEQKTTTGGGGNMWMEETIPSDALFYAPILASRARRSGSELDSGSRVLERFLSGVDPTYLQVGGNESVGQGWLRVATLFPETNVPAIKEAA